MRKLSNSIETHRGAMANTAERGVTDLSSPRAQVEGTDPSSRPPRRWLRRDLRSGPRALHGATVLKSVTGDQHGRMGEWANLNPSRVQVEGRPLLRRDSQPEPRALQGATALK
jgi:hypothetical protein